MNRLKDEIIYKISNRYNTGVVVARNVPFQPFTYVQPWRQWNGQPALIYARANSGNSKLDTASFDRDSIFDAYPRQLFLDKQELLKLYGEHFFGFFPCADGTVEKRNSVELRAPDAVVPQRAKPVQNLSSLSGFSVNKK